ncbi:aminoglycoside 6-adenylyltransferase [Paenibacillus chitinolyticus]|uniref:Aminoglycoside 6-adenylyltransferase n=1 Tax=Paenibacillus chitinolyticus TaxID=79263 RepID=A0A410WZ51_9BACL|nr:aminoglycoside 6-adenylyltransferase [Paenibacillus chitinolyticus]MCY9590397.1 aminoglycoside 6-adenylyltransferase [Paenibacillus chitinolyticus]MCY9596608.1 aminoglycoside 6-adenylyltransferase [Paenibacillus chitinolyticus]QAV19613.1 aminoglycoside 6-adenylyltransferase [Paenibacillus chitinolyticus]
MRSEQEMFDLIIKVAENDSRVRAVGLNGSRTNPNVSKDIFRDYDIVYLVTDVESFRNDLDWVNVFGERMIMQTPDDMALFPNEPGNRFAYLMLFTDGNRIDLTLIPLEEKEMYCREDKLTVILLDKDNDLPALPPPTDEDYWVQRPDAQRFADCCNEFWWVSTYVAKGLWRQEILYAIDHVNLVRAMLLKMLEWKVGMDTGFSLSIGKNSKFLKRYLDEESWNKLLSTYETGDYEQVWNALYVTGELFEPVALQVAAEFGYTYPAEEAEKIKPYLRRVQLLAPDARDI